MNKRILISVVLLIIAAALSVTSFFVLQSRFSALGEALQNAIYADVPTPDVNGRIADAWRRCAGSAQILLPHSDLTELQTAVECLPEFIGQPTVWRNTCVRCLHLLEGVRNSLLPSAGNIL